MPPSSVRPKQGRTIDVEMRQLRYFVAVAEERHFGRAADVLGITQPGLSQQIKNLERVIGAQLLERDKRHVALTKVGEVFLHYARLAIELTDRGLESARMAGHGKTTVLRIATHYIETPPHGKELLDAFGAQHPEVEIKRVSGIVPQEVEWLRRRDIDAAIIFAPFAAPLDVQYLALDTVEVLIALPRDHRLAALDRIPRSELSNETFLGFARDANPVFVDHLSALLFGEKPHERFIEVPALSETERLLRVANGEGLALASAVMPAFGMSEVVFRPVDEPRLLVEYGLAWLESSVSPFVATLVELARELKAARAEAPPVLS